MPIELLFAGKSEQFIVTGKSQDLKEHRVVQRVKRKKKKIDKQQLKR